MASEMKCHSDVVSTGKSLAVNGYDEERGRKVDWIYFTGFHNVRQFASPS
jgi:hypothetical protein